MTRPTILALVRHGESEWIAEGRFQGRGDPPLSDVGMRQAGAVGARLAAPTQMPSVPVPDTPPLAIWHSPLLRAAQTAQAIHEAREADAPLRPLDTLTELGQGEWEGLTHDEVRQRYPAELAAWREDPLDNQAPGGEALQDALLRARAAHRTILGTSEEVTASDEGAGKAPAEPVLGYERTFKGDDGPTWTMVVAHDGVLRLMMLDLLGIGIERFWAFPLALASVTVLDLSSGVVQLRAHNLDEHIAALSRRR
ncbi:MAG: histidine phosphatase family protein [Chloroflexota bacterium]|nr:histidine phosphatase family protein [Chloroflexota bacterium]